MSLSASPFPQSKLSAACSRNSSSERLIGLTFHEALAAIFSQCSMKASSSSTELERITSACHGFTSVLAGVTFQPTERTVAAENTYQPWNILGGTRLCASVSCRRLSCWTSARRSKSTDIELSEKEFWMNLVRGLSRSASREAKQHLPNGSSSVSGFDAIVLC